MNARQPGPPGWRPQQQWQPQHPWQQHQQWLQPGPVAGPGRPAVPAPRRTNAPLLVAAAVLVVAVGFTAIVLTRPSPTAGTRTAVTPQVTPEVTTPEVTPVITTTAPPTGLDVLPQRSWDSLPGANSTDEHWVVLQQNNLYGQPVPTMSCPEVPADGTFASETEFEVFMTAAIDCQRAGWEKTFGAIGQELVKPELTFIDGRVQTACGVSETTFYCGVWDDSYHGIFVQHTVMQEVASFRQMPFFTAAHEFAHHVQHMSKISWNGAMLSHLGRLDTMERSRRLELQASCWTSRIMAATPQVNFSQSDYAQYIDWTERDLGEVHGSAASNQYWWQRGFYMDQLSGCNTWTVDAGKVT